MVLFKQPKKPVIHATTGAAEVSTLRPVYVEKAPPCVTRCPNGNQVRDWLVPLAQHQAYGRTTAQAFETAWRLVTERNPFPSVCGRVCQHPCEAGCNRKEKDGAVAVHLVERFVGDFGIANALRTEKPTIANPGVEVAIVGAGPAGLSCAYHLARAAHKVTLFDAEAQPGGMMRYRIPRGVLPADILDAEIANVLSLGVECRTNCVVGRDISQADLMRGFSAVFFAVGLQKPAAMVPRTDCGVVTVGTLPAEAPIPRDPAPQQPDIKAANTVSIAIAQGREVAEAICAALEGRKPVTKPALQPMKSGGMKLDWYPAVARHEGATATDAAGEFVSFGLTDKDAIEEAKRCLSCGMCMDCENCWMYCTNNCFVRLPKGQHYKIKLELCNGCKKCADACPCGFIDMN